VGVKLGLDSKLFYSTTGIGGDPTWLPVATAREVNVPSQKGEADVSTRGGSGWKATVGALKDARLEFELVYDSADAACEALLEAFLSDATIGLAAADGPMMPDGHEIRTHFFMADCVITKFDRKEPLEQAVTISVTAKPTYSANPPCYGEFRSHPAPPPIP